MLIWINFQKIMVNKMNFTTNIAIEDSFKENQKKPENKNSLSFSKELQHKLKLIEKAFK